MGTTGRGQIDVGNHPPPEVVRLAAQAADNLNSRQAEITDPMTDLLAGIEYLVADQYLRDLMQASTEGNVKTIFHVIANQIPINHLQASTAAVEYALRLAQRGISANSLVRAYHMGQDNLLAAFFDEAQRLDCDADLKVEVMHHISNVLYQYIDWICVYLLDIYEEEQRRWSTTTGNVSASLIHKGPLQRGGQRGHLRRRNRLLPRPVSRGHRAVDARCGSSPRRTHDARAVRA